MKTTLIPTISEIQEMDATIEDGLLNSKSLKVTEIFKSLQNIEDDNMRWGTFKLVEILTS